MFFLVAKNLQLNHLQQSHHNQVDFFKPFAVAK